MRQTQTSPLRKPARRSHSRRPAPAMASKVSRRPDWRSPETRSYKSAITKSGARYTSTKAKSKRPASASSGLALSPSCNCACSARVRTRST
ncbi:hypothetical protein DAPPUDRAFT_272776 [Daphnia pulex]|uniref:Uncharacterized protein n=1 Tax=Daphnia pulex TaxID=6669 RepID=E9I372_DAPPU|nr:hypothetical protein DAPPUDRAFT_272776 [Daphnia pulex]|eukprot:EFX61559.1 hypothetical protein DAPPUDRAFT_272776 [Daphnia pulex]